MGKYEEAFARLNDAQRQAVETTEGPVLVVAGPGTGKTQLLGVRVAHILQLTDTLPQNILCLTFTESGANNMRERLTRFIGQAAYDVAISTYHAYGGDLIRRFPEAFVETNLQTPIDKLSQHQVLETILKGLSYRNPLKQLRHHPGDLITTISEIKRALLDGAALRAIAAENLAFVEAANRSIADIFKDVAKLPTTAAKALPLFEPLLPALQALTPDAPTRHHFLPLAELATTQLAAAIETARQTAKSTPLTGWKNTWLAKNADNQFVMAGTLEAKRIEALADVLEQYEKTLAEHGWYDFDDMILRAIQALAQNPDLRYSLQEQYLYIMLDEFQDTNAAQLKLIQLLSDNPVHEGRPNILAVGDDDQAIYAFQGAQYSNMLDFYQSYRDVAVINLTENYRSTADILATARAVGEQIEARLEAKLNLQKTLRAANPALPAQAAIDRREFMSDVAQFDWIAGQIKTLIEEGSKPSEIAVLAPKHKYLEPLVPYLADRGVPMRYEKRENILEAPVVRQLITMSRLVLALHDNNDGLADSLWPEVLSFDFWNIPTSELWQLSWQVSDQRSGGLTWSKALLGADQAYFKQPALLLLNLAGRIETEPCEIVLDYLIGSEPVALRETDIQSLRSPLRDFYTGEAVRQTNPGLFYETISHLTVLRAKLKEYIAAQTETPSLRNLISFVELYESSGERLQSTSPYNQQADAVQLMTVFKAKGLEFEHVFLPDCHDDVWGTTARALGNKLTLPVNLAPIRHAGATDDERLRILFVAMTRAKQGLHLTSFARTFTGKATKHLKYLDEQEQSDGSFRSLVLPERAQAVIASDHTAPTLESLELSWRKRHIDGPKITELRALLQDRLQRYQLSPTHLTKFIDLEYGGPEAFFFDVLLRFPHATSADSQFGEAIHEALEWTQQRTTKQSNLPPTEDILRHFSLILKKQKLIAEQFALQEERGHTALTTYLARRGHTFKPGDPAERNFRNEGVFLGSAHLGGKIDRLEIDQSTKTITVIDYKTGRGFDRWTSDTKLHKYQLQLYCYKILVEASHSFMGYSVNKGSLEFIEPDAEGRINSLELTFNDQELDRTKQLLAALWQRVQDLDFPDTSTYPPNLTGMIGFENDLLANGQN